MFIFYYTSLKNSITAHYFNIIIQIIFPVVPQPNASYGFPFLEVTRSHIMNHHSQWDSSG